MLCCCENKRRYNKLFPHTHFSHPQVLQEIREIQEMQVHPVNVGALESLVLLEIRESVELQVGMQCAKQLFECHFYQ